MTRLMLVGLLSCLSATALAEGKRKPPAPEVEPGQPPPQDPNQCTKAEGSARYVGMGYTHVLTLHNGCERPVACTLWSDVDPEPKQSVQAKPGERVEVVTRRGSPSRELTAFKSCTFR